MEITEDNYLAHYGILRRSGRYPWGSGGNAVSRSNSFFDAVAECKAKGLTDTEIARGFGMTTTELRATRSIANNQLKQANIMTAQKLKDKGMSNIAIGKQMSLNESSVRALLAPGEKEKADTLTTLSNLLREQVNMNTFVDVGKGVEHHLGVTADKLKVAIAMLKSEGFQTHRVDILQLGTGLKTNVNVLVPKGVTQKDVFLNRDKIKLINSFIDDQGRTTQGIFPPLSLNPDRVGVVYGKAGAEKDGVMYVRPDVSDLSLGEASYAQVRVLVGKGHFLKGMAMYSNDIPHGVDVLFHTNKEDSGNKLDALKPITNDPENPFGATIKLGGQQIERDKKGNPHVTSVMNILSEEGDWGKWSKNIASQVLSKQSPSLAEEQLKKARVEREKTFNEIMSLTNPVVKKKLLQDFADATDTAAYHLKAKALPGQSTHIILPIPTIPANHVYAPNYDNGTSVALIRYPHAGTFEIPLLTVDNNHKDSKRTLGQAKDAIGIHPSVAERMSGADFDGDFVLVIPNDHGKIKNSPALEGLKNFEPKVQYKKYEGMPIMTTQQKGREMGDISNLITDMTIKKASTDEIARAVRHSMVVIDAEKHELNYKQSAIDNGIPALKLKYQGGSRAGASTLISKAKSDVSPRILDRIPRRASEGGPIDPVTGAKVFTYTGATRKDKAGNIVPKRLRSAKLAEATDAHTLSSGTKIEAVYANHSNELKALANKARLETLSVPKMKYSQSAAKVYAPEVAHLTAQLKLSERNAPLERQAQIISGSVYKLIKQSNPHMDTSQEKKAKSRALNEARLRVGAKKDKIIISDREWEAIQAGAFSTSRLSDILTNSDEERVKKLATPRRQRLMTPANQAKARSLLASGATRAQVAQQLGVSLTTLDLGLQ